MTEWREGDIIPERERKRESERHNREREIRDKIR